MQRLRLYDMRLSTMPGDIGTCQADVPRIAQATNDSQKRLLYAPEAGDESWYGTFAEIVFNVSRTTPYVTLPRGIARLEAVNICNRPQVVQNQFYEYLQFGNGRLPKLFRHCADIRPTQVLSRNNVATFTDLTNAPQFIWVYMTNPADANQRVLIQGVDNNGNVIYTNDNGNNVNGVFLTLATPFVQTPMMFNTITGIQKDLTAGDVQFFQVDPTTGNQVLLLTMEPGETTAWYRRYYFDRLPCGCCPPANITPSTCQSVQVTAIAKLEMIPVRVDTDYTLLQNKEAIIEEAKANRYSKIDTVESLQMQKTHHKLAIGLLNGELSHYYGKDSPAVDFQPFGSARLERVSIGMI